MADGPTTLKAMDVRRGRIRFLRRSLNLPEHGLLPGSTHILSASRPRLVVCGLEGATIGFSRTELAERVREMVGEFGDEAVTLRNSEQHR
jgi:hypothetical protein